MKRKALIIYCDNTPPSKKLDGPPKDNNNYRRFLTSNYGGAWEPGEIESIQNPTINEVAEVINHMNGMDYTLTIFTGHGDMQKDNWGSWQQYCQVLDGEITVHNLKSDSKKKTVIIDACRKYEVSPASIIMNYLAAEQRGILKQCQLFT
jgi:hypothetical protein